MSNLLSIKITNSKNLNLYGTQHKARTLNKPLILIVHGYFSSNRIGPHRLYYQIAEYLCQNYDYNVFRFDLSGMGESEGNLNDVKIYDHSDDVEQIIKSIQQRFNDKPLIIIAHCMGCNISLPVINKLTNRILKCLFISPYFSTSNTLNSFFSNENIKEFKQIGYTYRKGIYADYSYFSGNNFFNPYSEKLRILNNKISVIYAEKDQYIPIHENKALLDLSEVRNLMICNADHNYLNNVSRNELFMAISKLLEAIT